MENIRANKTEDEIRTLVTDAMIAGGNANQPKLDRRQIAFRVAVVLLVAEVALLVWVLIVR
jgi:hypothetical protein